MPRGIYKRTAKMNKALSIRQRKRYLDPREREKQSEVLRRLWKRPSYRRKTVHGITKSWADPEKRRNRLKNRKPWIEGKSSPIHIKVFDFLKKKIEQLEIEYPISRMRIDIALPRKKLAIEIDGWHHRYFRKVKEADRKRDHFLKSEGWKVCRIRTNQKFEKIIQKALLFLGVPA